MLNKPYRDSQHRWQSEYRYYNLITNKMTRHGFFKNNNIDGEFLNYYL